MHTVAVQFDDKMSPRSVGLHMWTMRIEILAWNIACIVTLSKPRDSRV